MQIKGGDTKFADRSLKATLLSMSRLEFHLETLNGDTRKFKMCTFLIIQIKISYHLVCLPPLLQGCKTLYGG
jgi:hypothetical protein